MTPKELTALVKTLRMNGVSHFKSGDIELTLAPGVEAPVLRETKQRIPVSAPFEESKPIEHKVVELTSLLKLSDTELVDRLFPDYTEDQGGDEEPIDQAI